MVYSITGISDFQEGVCVCVGGGGPDPLTALLWIRPCIEKILIILSKSNQYSMCPQSIRLDTKFLVGITVYCICK